MNTFFTAFPATPGVALVYSDASIPGGNTTTSTSETTLTSTFSIPANSAIAGMQYWIFMEGTYGGTVMPTLTIKTKVGGQTILSTGALTGLVSGTDLEWKGWAKFTVKTLGVSGTIESNGHFNFLTAATTELGVNPASASYTVDFTASEAITVTVQWGAGGTAQTLTMRTMSVYAYSVTGVSNIFANPPTFSSMTPGSVLFIGTGGVVSEDNPNLSYDDSTDICNLAKSASNGTRMDVATKYHLACSCF